MSLLEVSELSVAYQSRGLSVLATRDATLSVEAGRLTAVVGESGSGKSTLGAAIAGTLPGAARVVGGSVVFDGQHMIGLNQSEWARSRGGGIAVMPQNSLNSLNPVLRIEGHFWDVLRSRQRIRRADARSQAAALLAKVGLNEDTLVRYPHELSGGMRQRICLAIVLCLRPRLIVFDEPTTALDVLTQQQVITTIAELQRSEGFAGLLISHDLGFALQHTSQTVIMYGGRIIEQLPSDRVLTDAQHPYTQALLRCYADPRADVVSLAGIPGRPPDLSLGVETSCLFAPRCMHAHARCEQERPDLHSVADGQVACFFVEDRLKETLHAH